VSATLPVLALAALVAAPGGTLRDQFDAGATHYWAGRHQQAYQTWREIESFGVVDADLYYDLGNAAYQMGRVGEALGWYERARRLDPHDGDLQANITAAELRLAASKVVSVVEKGTAAGEGSFESWYRLFTYFTGAELAGIFGFFWIGFFVLVLLLRRMELGTPRILLSWVSIAVLLIAIGWGALLVGSTRVADTMVVGVVTERSAQVRSGPTREGRALFELPEGQFVRILERQGQWRRALVNPSLQGWVASSDLMEVR
jgi:tetratricopeptide (TPR) repeat protein